MTQFINGKVRNSCGDELSAHKTSAQQPVRTLIVFRNVQQALLFERLLKRLTRDDLLSLMFIETEVNLLLTALGDARKLLKTLATHRTETSLAKDAAHGA